jgi:hypothetical protein
MKFLVPNYGCLQNPWLEGYRPQIPVLSVLSPQQNLLNPLLRKKFMAKPLFSQIWLYVRTNNIVNVMMDYNNFTLFIPCVVIQLVQLKPTKWTPVLILVSQNLFYMFCVTKVHHEEVSCTIQTLIYSDMSSVYGVMVNQQCVLYIRWSRYTEIVVMLLYKYMKIK